MQNPVITCNTNYRKELEWTKQCPLCKLTKDISEFAGNGYCKPCYAAYMRERRRAAKPEPMEFEQEVVDKLNDANPNPNRPRQQHARRPNPARTCVLCDAKLIDPRVPLCPNCFHNPEYKDIVWKLDDDGKRHLIESDWLTGPRGLIRMEMDSYNLERREYAHGLHYSLEMAGNE